ncbi:hypothetical protein PR048_026331 [Dryococelus australis]|uniref:Uncharacterized protein n=1 Tax=Dryococelus australis TaxID=614101 RepID=A0ABQ9GL16_9NEOP|nr:hypothetical protein PR048_026331 [Dryococelus australis]
MPSKMRHNAVCGPELLYHTSHTSTFFQLDNDSTSVARLPMSVKYFCKCTHPGVTNVSCPIQCSEYPKRNKLQKRKVALHISNGITEKEDTLVMGEEGCTLPLPKFSKGWQNVNLEREGDAANEGCVSCVLQKPECSAKNISLRIISCALADACKLFLFIHSWAITNISRHDHATRRLDLERQAASTCDHVKLKKSILIDSRLAIADWMRSKVWSANSQSERSCEFQQREGPRPAKKSCYTLILRESGDAECHLHLKCVCTCCIHSATLRDIVGATHHEPQVLVEQEVWVVAHLAGDLFYVHNLRQNVHHHVRKRIRAHILVFRGWIVPEVVSFPAVGVDDSVVYLCRERINESDVAAVLARLSLAECHVKRTYAFAQTITNDLMKINIFLAYVRDLQEVRQTFETNYVTLESHRKSPSHIAWDMLIAWYYNKRLIAALHVDSLLKVPSVFVNSPASLCQLLTIITENIAALEALDVPVKTRDFIMLAIFCKRLAVPLQIQWEMTLPDSELPSMGKFIKFLEKHCRCQDTVTYQTLSTVVQPKSKVGVLSVPPKPQQLHSRNFLIDSRCPLQRLARHIQSRNHSLLHFTAGTTEKEVESWAESEDPSANSSTNVLSSVAGNCKLAATLMFGLACKRMSVQLHGLSLTPLSVTKGMAACVHSLIFACGNRAGDAACWRVFSGYSRFPRPCIPAPLHPRVSFHVMSGDYGHLRVPAGKPVTREWQLDLRNKQDAVYELVYQLMHHTLTKVNIKLAILSALTMHIRQVQNTR